MGIFSKVKGGDDEEDTSLEAVPDAASPLPKSLTPSAGSPLGQNRTLAAIDKFNAQFGDGSGGGIGTKETYGDLSQRFAQEPYQSGAALRRFRGIYG